MRRLGLLASVLAGAGVLGSLPAAAQTSDAGAPAAPYVWVSLLCIAGAGLALALWFCLRAQRRFTLLEAGLNAVPQPRQIVDREGRVILANPACQTEFGAAEGNLPALLGEQTKDIAESQEAVQRLSANARGGTADHAEIRVPCRSGTTQEAWRRVTAYPLKGRPGCVLWLVDDITAERQMEMVLQEEQARFVDLLEHAPIGFYSVDAEGQFLFVNQTLADWLGLPPEELLGGERRLHDVVGSAASSAAAYDPFVGGEDPLRGEVTLCGADGLAFTALISQDVVSGDEGQVLRTRSVVRNLSRERAVEEALAHSVQRFKRFFEEAPIGIALLDPDGRIAETNASFRGQLDLPQDGIEGKPLVDLVAEDERDSVAKTIAAAGSDPSGDPTIEVRFRGGPEVVCALYVNRLEGVEGQPAGYITHFIDTDRAEEPGGRSSSSPRRCRRWASWPAASRTTSTTC